MFLIRNIQTNIMFRMVNWPIHTNNSFNWVHSKKYNVWNVINWPIDVGNSFSWKQSNKYNIWSVINWPVNVSNSKH